jgi:hypothetical protein
MNRSPSLGVPSALYGTHQEVRRRWSRITGRAIAARSWALALHDVDYLDLASSDAHIAVGDSSGTMGNGSCFRPYIVHDLLLTEADRKAARSKRRTDFFFPSVRALHIEGTGMFWFVLSCVCSRSGAANFPGSASESKAFAESMVQSLLQWWPGLCALDRRMCGDLSRGWPNWCGYLYLLHHYLNPEIPAAKPITRTLQRLQQEPAEKAIRTLRNWLP